MTIEQKKDLKSLGTNEGDELSINIWTVFDTSLIQSGQTSTHVRTL